MSGTDSHIDPDIAAALATVPPAGNTIQSIRDTVNGILIALGGSTDLPLPYEPVEIPVISTDPTLSQLRDCVANMREAVVMTGAGKNPAPEE